MYDNLLWILANKKNYYKYKDMIQSHVVTPEIMLVVEAIDSYFKKNPTILDIDYSVFIPWFKLTKTSKLSKEKISFLDKIFSILLEEEPSEEEKKETLNLLLEQNLCNKIADYCIKITEGDDTKALLDIEDFISDYKSESGKITEIDALFDSTDIDEILDNHLRPGLEWRLEELNRSLGPLRKGDLVIVTSAPDSGKTTFLCSESTFMANQMDPEQDVIWFNNEEQVKKVRSRIYQAALGWTKEKLADNKLVTKAELEKVLGRLDRIKVVDDKLLSVHKVEEILRECNPGLIIFDQLWKVVGFTNSFSEVDKQNQLFSWARSLADKYAPVINVHQADGTAQGEAYIQMHQLYNSRVGIQGEADAIIGIGRSYDPSVDPETRFLHISKNKLDGGPRSVDTERNGKYEIQILRNIARYKGSKYT